MSSLVTAWNAILGMVNRGKVLYAQVGTQRTALQIGALAGDVYNYVPLYLPYGMSALPAGGDVVLLCVAGCRDEKIALFADNPALRITDLGGGEYGFSDGAGQRVVFRSDRLELTATTKPIAITASAGMTISATGGTTMAISCDAPVNLTAPEVHLGEVGGRRVVLDGDPCSDGGTVRATSEKLWGS